MLQPLAESLRLFHGPGTSTAVEVFVSGSWPRPSVSGNLVLKGPYCERARTLPASFRLQRVTAEQWKTTVVDPCFWSPGFPARYRLQAADHGGDQPCFEVALRRSSAHAGHLWLDGRRWVFRGVTGRQFSIEQVTQCAEEYMGLVVDAGQLDPFVASAATASGTPLMLNLQCAQWRGQLASAARCPAVQLVRLPAKCVGDRNELEQIAPQMFFVADVPPGDTLQVPAWADALLISADHRVMEAAGRLQPARPLIVIHPGTAEDADEASFGQRVRRQCEQLQRDLAPRFDLSGYIVDRPET